MPGVCLVTDVPTSASNGKIPHVSFLSLKMSRFCRKVKIAIFHGLPVRSGRRGRRAGEEEEEEELNVASCHRVIAGDVRAAR